MKKMLCVLLLSTFFSSSISLGTVFGYQLDIFRITFLAFTILHFIFGRNKIRATKKAVLIIFALMCCVLLTLINCVDVIPWTVGVVNTLLIVLCVLYIPIYTDNSDDLILYIRCFGIGCLITCLVSTFEFNTGIHIARNYADAYLKNSWEYSYLIKAPTAFLYNPNNIAALLLMALPLGSYMFGKTRANKSALKIIWYLLAIYTLFMTGSRAGLIAGPIIVAILVGFDPSIKRNYKILTCTLFAASFVVFVILNKSYLLKQIDYSGLLKDGVFSLFREGDASRVQLIEHGITVISNTYLLGCGPMCLNSYLSSVYGYSEYIHMFWVELLACYGIGVFTCFVKCYIGVLHKLMRYARKDALARDIFISVITFAFAAIIVPTIFTQYYFWFVIGFAIAYLKTSNINKPLEVNV